MARQAHAFLSSQATPQTLTATSDSFWLLSGGAGTAGSNRCNGCTCKGVVEFRVRSSGSRVWGSKGWEPERETTTSETSYVFKLGPLLLPSVSLTVVGAYVGARHSSVRLGDFARNFSQ